MAEFQGKRAFGMASGFDSNGKGSKCHAKKQIVSKGINLNYYRNVIGVRIM
ncbi:hypothetical protein GMMP15_620016 [Candidatus Magnetomoraceae bacterium gMMP-15]